jgi:hypothetical protein
MGSPRRCRRSAVKRRVCSSSSNNKKVLSSSTTNYLSTFLDYESPSKPTKVKKCPPPPTPPPPPPLLPTTESLLDIVSTPVRRQYHRHHPRLLFDEGVGARFVTMVVPTKMHDGPSLESYTTPPQARKTRRQRLV